MNLPKNIASQTTYENGVILIVAYAQKKGGRAPYPVIWGYVFNGVKYTSKKKADEAAK